MRIFHCASDEEIEKGEIKTKGVMPPEGLEPEPFIAKLAEKGLVFQERATRKIRP
jgi:saccharopine dehydrogenase-like NADP-dependent oxidoreductase